MAEGEYKKDDKVGPSPTFGSEPVAQAFQAATEAQKSASVFENRNNSASILGRRLTDGGKASEKPPTTLTNAPPNPFKTLLLPTEAGFRENQNAYQSSEAIPSGCDQYLEAYIACPQAQNTGDTVIWSYKVDILPLDEAAVRAHLRKLASDYSVLDSIADLPPALSNVVQNRKKDRNVQLVLVQDGKNTGITRGMGAFNVKSIIFVIRIGLNCLGVIKQAQVTEGEKGESAGFKPVGFLSGNSTPVFHPKENNTNNNTNNNPFFTPVQPNSINAENIAQEPTSKFQSMIKDLDFGRDERMKERNITIIGGNKNYRPSLSLEELRVADYAAGCTGPSTSDSILHSGPSAKPTYILSAEKPLGSGYGTLSSGTFGATSNNPVTGYSGSRPSQTQPNPRPSGPTSTLSSSCAPPKPKSPLTAQEQGANPFSGFSKAFLVANPRTPVRYSSLTPTTEQKDKCKKCSANLVSSSEADRAIGSSAADAEPEAEKAEESRNNPSHAPPPQNILPIPGHKQHGAAPGTLFPISRATFVADTNGVVHAQGILGPSQSSSFLFSPSRLPSFQFSSSSQAKTFSFGTNSAVPPFGFTQDSAPNLETSQIGSSGQGKQKTEDGEGEKDKEDKEKDK